MVLGNCLVSLFSRSCCHKKATRSIVSRVAMPRSVASVSALFRRATTTRKKRTGSDSRNTSKLLQPVVTFLPPRTGRHCAVQRGEVRSWLGGAHDRQVPVWTQDAAHEYGLRRGPGPCGGRRGGAPHRQLSFGTRRSARCAAAQGPIRWYGPATASTLFLTIQCCFFGRHLVPGSAASCRVFMHGQFLAA